MHPYDDGGFLEKLYIVDHDGVPISLQKMEELPVIEDPKYPIDHTAFDLESIEVSVKIALRHWNGVKDCFFNRNTGAARRYIRAMKRQREKERRLRLKNGKDWQLHQT